MRAWVAGGAACALFGVSEPAQADEVLAAPCAGDARTCQHAPLSFSKSSGSPIEFSFDTGWTPPGSPLQVHLWGLLATTTAVRLDGALDTTWPDALTLSAPGALDGGLLSYHYGVDIGAQAKIEVTILNQPYSWIGDIPYVPQIDFQVKADQVFDAWGWAPGVTATDSTEPVNLAMVDLIGLAIPIPGLEGGFALDVALDLEVTYVTDRIVIEDAGDGEAVAGGALDGPSQETLADYAGGPAVTYDVRPEGRVTYDTTLHLIPSLYIEVLGNTQTMPLADIPVNLPSAEVDWVFDPARVRVPLPDIVAATEPVELGTVTLGDQAVIVFPVTNDGEMPLYVTAAVGGDFAVASDEQVIAPGDTLDLELTFAPASTGTQAKPLVLVSNDPDTPSVAVTLRGTGVEEGGSLPPSGSDEPAPPSLADTQIDAGCACRTGAGRDPSTPLGHAAWLFAALALATRRRPAR